MTPLLLVITDRRFGAACCHQLLCRRTLWTALQAARSTETSVPGRGEDVDSEVETTELLVKLQDSISIEGRSGRLRMFIQGVGFREGNSNIERRSGRLRMFIQGVGFRGATVK